MHVQSCCFANINLSLFCRSPWQRDVTKRERMVTKRKGPWEGERLEVSPVFSFSSSFARKFSSRESRLGQQAAPEGERTRTLAEAFIYKHISVATLKNTC